MSENNPNPEERERIVDDVIKNILSPKFKQGKEDELTILFKKRDQWKSEVYDLLRPIVGQALLRSPIDPQYPHNESGRLMLIGTAHKFFLDRMRTLSKDEAIFMLAFMCGERTVEDLV